MFINSKDISLVMLISKSEIVVPIFKDDKIIGVLDIDAPITDRFDDNDKEHLEAIVKIIEKQLA